MAAGAITGVAVLDGRVIECHSGASAADTALTISTNTSRAFKLLHVDVHYSAAPTQAGVTTTLNSHLGAAYDTVLDTGTANAQNTVYVPAGGQMFFLPGDALDVLAPAAGGVITSQISIYLEAL